MPTSRALRATLVLLPLLLVTAPGARAEWPSDPATNLAIADAASDQAQAKMVPGGSALWLSWFDGIASGYDVRLQQIDSFGVEVFAHGGLLVADRGFSSTQDYGLATDYSGDALLVFRDDRPGSVQITATKVTTAGAMPWGVSGVQLTSTTDFVAAPKIAGTPDGGCLVAWTQNSSTRLRKLDADGALEWAGDVILAPSTGSYSASDLQPAGSGAVLAFVHQTGGFGSPRHLLAQRFDDTGAALWDSTHVKVFDGGSLQFGNFPTFAPDGGGGGVFAWYDAASTALQCYVQRILGNGTEAFAHNGVAVSTNATRVRVSPSVWFEPGLDNTYVYWQELSSNQAQSGVYGQRLDASGARQWGAEGAVVVAVGATSTPIVRAAGRFVFWTAVPSFGTDRLYGARVSNAGGVDLGPFDVCSVPSGKSRVALAPLSWVSVPVGPRSGAPFVVLAWGDARDDDGDIYVQNVNSDGSLGPFATDAPVVPGAPADRRGRAVPNPSSSSVRFTVRIPRDGTAMLRVFDAAGRLVRRHAVTGEADSWTWDGRDDLGRDVGSGVYFVELRHGGAADVQRVVRFR